MQLQYLEFNGQDKGWPVAGMTMQIENEKAVHVNINGKSLDPGKF